TTLSAAAFEAAQHHLQQQPVVFEFVAPRTSRWQTMLQRFDSRRRRWITAAALGLVVLPALVFVVRSRIESGLEAEWNGMRNKVGEVELQQQKIRQFRPWFEPAPQSLQILEGLTGAFPEQGEVWAKSIQIAGGANGEGVKVTCSGLARNEDAFTGLRERLRSRPDVAGLKVQQMVQVQQARGESQVQFSITYQWKPRDAK
nr:hypothetical protein [Verrucomicrobiota bacterium]